MIAVDRIAVERAVRRQVSSLAWRKIHGAMGEVDDVRALVDAIGRMQASARSSKRDLGIAWGILSSRFDLLPED